MTQEGYVYPFQQGKNVSLFFRGKGNPNFIGLLTSAVFYFDIIFKRYLNFQNSKGQEILKRAGLADRRKKLSSLHLGLETKVNFAQSEFLDCMCPKNLLIKGIVNL